MLVLNTLLQNALPQFEEFVETELGGKQHCKGGQGKLVQAHPLLLTKFEESNGRIQQKKIFLVLTMLEGVLCVSCSSHESRSFVIVSDGPLVKFHMAFWSGMILEHGGCIKY